MEENETSRLTDSTSSPYLLIEGLDSVAAGTDIGSRGVYGSIMDSSSQDRIMQQRTGINEMPPAYETILSKSSSLPSYRQIDADDDGGEKEKNVKEEKKSKLSSGEKVEESVFD